MTRLFAFGTFLLCLASIIAIIGTVELLVEEHRKPIMELWWTLFGYWFLLLLAFIAIVTGYLTGYIAINGIY